MKKFVLIALLLVLGTTYAQDFRANSLEIKTGYSYLDDQHAKSEDNIPSTFGISFRHNYTPKFGLALNMDWDRINLNNGSTESFFRATVTPTFEVMDLVGIYNPRWTLLGNVGGGIGRVVGEDRGIATAGFKALHKVSEVVVLQLGYQYTGIFYQDYTWDQVRPTTARGITSVVHNITLGVNLNFKKRNDDRMHADWIVPECCAKGGDTIINKNTYVTKNQITKVIKEEYTPIIREYVFFDHDKEEIRESELNAIMQIFTYLRENQDAKVMVRGWASNTKSSKEYNLALSERRCKELVKKFMDLGIPLRRISTDPSGKDYDMSKENVHDLARRVELLVIE